MAKLPVILNEQSVVQIMNGDVVVRRDRAVLNREEVHTRIDRSEGLEVAGCGEELVEKVIRLCSIHMHALGIPAEFPVVMTHDVIHAEAPVIVILLDDQWGVSRPELHLSLITKKAAGIVSAEEIKQRGGNTRLRVRWIFQKWLAAILKVGIQQIRVVFI